MNIPSDQPSDRPGIPGADPEVPWPNGRAYKLILREIQAMWSSHKSRTGAGGFIQTLFGFVPARRLHILEYEDVNLKKPGFDDDDLLRSWTYDDKGLRSAPPPAKVRYYDNISTATPILRFTVRPDSEEVVVEEHYGPNAGRGILYDYSSGDLEFCRFLWQIH